MIGGILFIALSVVLASISGFSACLGTLMCDPVLQNRLFSSFWCDTLIKAFIDRRPKEITLTTALSAVVSFLIGLICLA